MNLSADLGGFLPPLLLASLLLLVAHVARAARVALLFPANYLANRFNLLLGLAIGYGINAILPWRLGEVARAWFVSRRDRVRFSYSAAVVVAERFSDIVMVALIAGALPAFGMPGLGWTLPLLLSVAAVVLLAFAVAVHGSAPVRRAIWWAGSMFNDRIRFGIADFCWSLSELVTSGALLARNYLVATAGMWAIYITSYALYARATGNGLLDSVALLLGAPLRPAVAAALAGSGSEAGSLLLFTGLPVVAIIAYGIVKQGPALMHLLQKRRRFGMSRASLRSTTHDRFTVTSEYEYFLVALFGGSNHTVSGFGLDALDDGVVHRLFAGGSDAITALVEVDGSLVIRKFATGDPGDKLKVQADWLAGHRSSDLPLVDIVRHRAGAKHFLYDMPLVVPANDFYDVIHTSPIERSKAVLSEVADRIHAFHGGTARAAADGATVAAYLEGKATRNARQILRHAEDALSGREYAINGKRLSLDAWDRLLDPAWLMAQVENRGVSTVHGDLTIENIIVAPDRAPGWYIIDPNSENTFDSPLIDWAKLMQSLHLGYEGLNRSFGVRLSDREIMLPVTKSAAYSELHTHLEALISRYRGPDALREVYFHELINYLRLTPYKFRHSEQKGLCFFACTSLLLDRYMRHAR